MKRQGFFIYLNKLFLLIKTKQIEKQTMLSKHCEFQTK